jgi:hypothetical protein
MTKRLAAILWLLLFLVSTALADVKRYDVPIGDAPIRGAPDAPVTIIEFLDFQ